MQSADKDVVDDLEKGWKPNGRPQSTVARNFSAALDDLFRLDGGLDSLSKNVHQKKYEVSSQSQELEALEARLRATEERLKKAGSNPAPFPNSRKNSQRRTPVKGAFGDQENVSSGAPAKQDTSQAAEQRPNSSSRPQSGNRPNESYAVVDRPIGS